MSGAKARVGCLPIEDTGRWRGLPGPFGRPNSAVAVCRWRLMPPNHPVFRTLAASSAFETTLCTILSELIVS